MADDPLRSVTFRDFQDLTDEQRALLFRLSVDTELFKAELDKCFQFSRAANDNDSNIIATATISKLLWMATKSEVMEMLLIWLENNQNMTLTKLTYQGKNS